MNILEINLLLIFVYAFILLLFIKTKFTKKLFVIITTLQMIIFNGLRHVTVGNDTIRYQRNYYRVKEVNNISELISFDYELGYQIAQKIITLFTNNFNVWLFIIALFVFILLGIFIYKYSKDYFLSYLLFITLGFYDFSFTAIKQTIAMIIILHTYKHILNRNFIKFFLLVVCASAFHLSAFLFFPVYFIANIKWDKYYIFLVLNIYILFYILRFKIGKLLIIIYYKEYGEIFEKYISSGTVGGLTILIFIILLSGYFIYNPIRYKEKENIVLSNILIMAFFIQSLSSFVYLFTRLNMYFLIFVVLYIPNFLYNIDKIPIRLNKLEKKVIRIFIKITIITSFSLYYLNNLKYDGSGIIPYLFFWE